MNKNSSKEQIKEAGCQIVSENPGGITRINLIGEVTARLGLPRDDVGPALWQIQMTCRDKVRLVEKGLFAPALDQVLPDAKSLSEKDLYAPFAHYLQGILGECQVAVALGGATVGWKWGTPDVVGTNRTSESDLIKFPTEIVVAEVKAKSSEAITGLGQAVAYRLFANRVYLVVPRALKKFERCRLESVCHLVGIGLVFWKRRFDAAQFELRNRATAFTPDPFYANEFAAKVKDSCSEMGQKLFG